MGVPIPPLVENAKKNSPKPYRVATAVTAGVVAGISLGVIVFAWYDGRTIPWFFAGLLGWALTLLTGVSPFAKARDWLNKK